MCTILFYVHNNVQTNLGPPVTLVWMSLNHQVLLAWWQVSVGNIIECFNYTGYTNLKFISAWLCDKFSAVHFVYNLLGQWQELQLQQ